ncbi:MAG: hypothetical protein PHS59_12305 [Paludibacter sp.]|nr:hypothetical protein [Paludibacter sp.]
MYQFKRTLLLSAFILINVIVTMGQSAWPSKSWTSAVNLSSVLSPDVSELSGLYWNNTLKRLFCAADNGQIYVLQFNKTKNSFSLLATYNNIGSPEGIMQVDNNSNEFYTINESDYQIRKYSFDEDFSIISKEYSWSLLKSPSPMINTGNTGPEGITFIPDSYLAKVGFISSISGEKYISTKGMGGLVFIAHQNGGYIWVFDLNPDKKNDFAFVGFYKTKRDESCELSFDTSTGLLYILHNTGLNYLEVTDLKTTKINNEYKLNSIIEYYIPNPDGNTNIEGFAIKPKYPDSHHVNVWLCRDVKIHDTEHTDCIRWFTPFESLGKKVNTSGSKLEINNEKTGYFTNSVAERYLLNYPISTKKEYSYRIYNSKWELLSEVKKITLPVFVDLKNEKAGVYFIRLIHKNKTIATEKIIKVK